MADRYVDFINGSDLNGGTDPDTDAYKSINEAFKDTSLNAGDTVWLVDCTTASTLGAFEHSIGSAFGTTQEGTAANPITVRPINGYGNVIMDRVLYNYDADYVNFQDIIVQMSLRPGTEAQHIKWGDTPGGSDAVYPIGGRLDNCTVQHATGAGVVTSAVSFEGAEGLVIDNCLFDNIRGRKAGTETHAFQSPGAYIKDVTISNCTFRDISGDVFQFGLDASITNKQIDGFIFENNLIEISSPYQYRDGYGNTYATAPTYDQQASKSDIEFSSSPAKITSTTTDLSGFIAGSCITVTGTTSNNKRYTVSAVNSSTDLSVIETPTTESPGSCTLTSFNASYCGEGVIDIKEDQQGRGIILRNNTIKNYRKVSVSNNQDASGANAEWLVVHDLATGPIRAYGNEVIDCLRCVTMAADNASNPTHPYLTLDIEYTGNIHRTTAGTDVTTYESGSIVLVNFDSLDGTVRFNHNVYDYGDHSTVTMWREDTCKSTIVLECKNNIVLNTDGTYSCQDTGTLYGDFDYNLYYDRGTASPAGSFSYGTGNHFQGAGDVTTDPALTAEYKPSVNSALAGTGVFTTFSAKDFNLRPYRVPPSIGCYESTSGFPITQPRNPRT